MLLSSLLVFAILSVPAGANQPRGSFDSVVPELPGGYGPGRVSIRVLAVEMPQSSSPALIGDLVARTGVAITETQGIRIEMTLPDDVRFESMRARVVDGLVLQPQQRSFIGRVGTVLVSLFRLLLVGKLVSAADDLSVSGAIWATALGMPDTDDEIVRLSTSEMLSFGRDAAAFSDHDGVAIYRTMLALSPWTELTEIELRCTDQTSGEKVAFYIPRLVLHGNELPDTDRAATWQLVMAQGH